MGLKALNQDCRVPRIGTSYLVSCLSRSPGGTEGWFSFDAWGPKRRVVWVWGCGYEYNVRMQRGACSGQPGQVVRTVARPRVHSILYETGECRWCVKGPEGAPGEVQQRAKRRPISVPHPQSATCVLVQCKRSAFVTVFWCDSHVAGVLPPGPHY